MTISPKVVSKLKCFNNDCSWEETDVEEALATNRAIAANFMLRVWGGLYKRKHFEKLMLRTNACHTNKGRNSATKMHLNKITHKEHKQSCFSFLLDLIGAPD